MIEGNANDGLYLSLEAASSNDPDARGFLDVPNASRMRMQWVIFGPAWTAAECERDLMNLLAGLAKVGLIEVGDGKVAKIS